MRTPRPLLQPLACRPEVPPSPAVLGLRDTWLLAAVRAAVSSSGFAVADVAGSANQLLYMTAYRRPRLIVAALDVLGAEPLQVIRRVLTRSPSAAIVVLSPLDTVPAWLLEAGADAVVAQTDIVDLKRVLRELRDR